ncbi:hypothetical protein BRL74_24525, partial [Xanthomonas oryzae pv. oryzae]
AVTWRVRARRGASWRGPKRISAVATHAGSTIANTTAATITHCQRFKVAMIRVPPRGGVRLHSKLRGSAANVASTNLRAWTG